MEIKSPSFIGRRPREPPEICLPREISHFPEALLLSMPVHRILVQDSVCLVEFSAELHGSLMVAERVR